MDLVEDLAEPGVSMVAACAALGVSRATLYRTTSPARLSSLHQRSPSPRRLDDSERQAILDVMHSEEFVDQPPMEVFAKLLSRGIYMASIRTFYRVLAELGESKERRNQRLPHPYIKPSLTGCKEGQRPSSRRNRSRSPWQVQFRHLAAVATVKSDSNPP